MPGQISLGWTIKNAAIAVGLDYQYSFKIIKRYNELGEEGVKNLKKNSAEHRRGKEPFETIQERSEILVTRCQYLETMTNGVKKLTNYHWLTYD